MFKRLIFFFLLIGFLLIITPAYGQGLVPEASGPSCDKGDATYCGNYELNDFVVLAIKVSRWILGIVGSLALLMFIYGGVMFLTSAGGSDAISKAKKIIIAAIIGLIIVLGSWLIIRFVMQSMGLTWEGKIETPQTVQE